MAREVKATAYTNRHYPDRTTYTFGPEQLKAFEALVRADEREIVMNEPLTKAQWQRFEDEIRADEREACAKVLADRANHIENNHRRPHYGFPYELRQSIAAIRARSKDEKWLHKQN
jgi:hypothetical protein